MTPNLFARSRAQLFTIGYQRLTPDQLLEIMEREQIDLVIDVRRRAFSRIPGWSGPALIPVIGREKYWHRPALGNHKNMTTPGWQMIDRVKADAAIEEIKELLKEGKRVCILCLEPEYADCHRWMVSACISDNVIHLT